MADIKAADNQAGIDLIAPPSTRGVGAARIFDVPLVRATTESLATVGARPVSNFDTAVVDVTPWPTRGWRALVPGTGSGGGTVAGIFTNERIGLVQYSVNVALGRKYITGWYGEDPAHAAAVSPTATVDEPRVLKSILTHEANYHPDGGQVICARPGGSPFILLLAPPGDDIMPSSFRAFLVEPPMAGVHIGPGTWHQPAFPAYGSTPGSLLDNRQGAVHACVSSSFIHDFGGYLRVPLSAEDVKEAMPTPPAPPQGPRLGYVIMYVKDVRRALDFYVDAFGLRERFIAPGGQYGEVETGATALGFAAVDLARSNLTAVVGSPASACFTESTRASVPPGVEVGLIVPDVFAAVGRALAAGALLVADPTVKPWGQTVAFVRDIDGFLVELCSAIG